MGTTEERYIWRETEREREGVGRCLGLRESFVAYLVNSEQFSFGLVPAGCTATIKQERKQSATDRQAHTRANWTQHTSKTEDAMSI
jgi:hypothetical protein